MLRQNNVWCLPYTWWVYFLAVFKPVSNGGELVRKLTGNLSKSTVNFIHQNQCTCSGELPKRTIVRSDDLVYPGLSFSEQVPPVPSEDDRWFFRILSGSEIIMRFECEKETSRLKLFCVQEALLAAAKTMLFEELQILRIWLEEHIWRLASNVGLVFKRNHSKT